MRVFSPFTASHLRAIALVGLGTAAIASCGVDQTGLGSMPFLPHDASAGGGTSGTTGVAGTGGSAVAGTGGSATGVGGTVGVAGTSGTAGTAGVAGTTGDAGSTGTAGTTGDAGTSGTAGTSGVAGTGGAAGTTGVAGTGGAAGTTGVAGTGGAAGTTGVAGTGVAGGGGTGGSGGSGGRGGTGGSASCTPTNCSDGCCNGNFCVRQRSAFLCGAQGAACKACALCETCSSMGQCRIDSASRWTISAVSAELSGGGWDRNMGDVGGSQPDPFCEFENPAGQVTTTTAGVTDTITDDATPTWNQIITPVNMTVSAATLMSTNPPWQIWVGDDDGCRGIGGCTADTACTIRQQISESTLQSGRLVVSNRQNCAQVTLDFICQGSSTAASH